MSSVSVIIPCYNYAHFLRDCVESVLSQAGVDVRVLVIDDASSDSTAEVAAGLIAAGSPVEYRRHVENQGHIATYNEGLAWASADYTVLLSADDLLAPGALRRAVQLLDGHPEVGLVYGGCVKFVTGQPLPHARLPVVSSLWHIHSGSAFLERMCKNGHCFISSPEVVVRTSLQRKLGGYRLELTHTGDMEMWMRFAAHASVGQLLDADQAYYRLHGRNMHTGLFAAAARDVQQRRAAFDFVFQEYRDLIPGWERLQRLADRSLASDALWAACQALYHRQASQTPVNELVRYATSSYHGDFWSLDHLRVYVKLISRILESAQRKVRTRLSHTW